MRLNNYPLIGILCCGFSSIAQTVVDPTLNRSSESKPTKEQSIHKPKKKELDPFQDAHAILEKERQFHLRESSKSPESSLKSEATKGKSLEK